MNSQTKRQLTPFPTTFPANAVPTPFPQGKASRPAGHKLLLVLVFTLFPTLFPTACSLTLFPPPPLGGGIAHVERRAGAKPYPVLRTSQTDSRSNCSPRKRSARHEARLAISTLYSPPSRRFPLGQQPRGSHIVATVTRT